MLAEDHDNADQADHHPKRNWQRWFFVPACKQVDHDHEHRHQGTYDGSHAAWYMHFRPGDQSVAQREHEKSTDCLPEDMFLVWPDGFSYSEHKPKQNEASGCLPQRGK